MVVKERKTTKPTKSTASKAALVPVSDKKVVTPRKKSAIAKEQNTKKSVSIPLEETREPKNGFVVITNNIQKRARVKKDETQVVSTSVLPKPAIRSPFRFPMLSEKTLVYTARVLGIFLIAIGTMLSVLSIPSMRDVQHAFLAAVISSDISTTTTTTATSNAVTVDETPKPNISVPSDTMTGITPITIIVPYATNVYLILEKVSTGKLFTLGNASPLDSNNWLYQLNTQNIVQGEYRFKVVVSNKYRTYDFTDPKVYQIIPTVFNTQNNQPTSSTTKTNIVSTTSVSTAGTSTIKFSLDQSNNPSEVIFSVAVERASKVSVSSRNVTSGIEYFVGYATQGGDGTWKLLWDTMKIPDGTYDFVVTAVVDSVVYESDKKRISIANSLESNYDTSLDYQLLKTDILLSVHTLGSLTGYESIDISTSPVEWVELYSVAKNDLSSHFLGRASKNSSTNWTFLWDTTQTPNGEYSIFARVKNNYGYTESDKTSVRILNPISSYNDDQKTTISSLQSASVEINQAVETNGSSKDYTETHVESIESFVSGIATDDTVRTNIQSLLLSYRNDLLLKLSALAKAKRAGDTAQLKSLESEIEILRINYIKKLPNSIENSELIERVSAYISQITVTLHDSTLQNEMILKERVGDGVSNDSDKDGVSDYDEVNLYNTNPFSADTDGDGFIDGTEISLGYNPLNASREALITYQSPIDSGTVREDLLTIDTLTTLTSDTPGELPKAFFSGKGLPNSFVTLYIYSTPIVITVKTDTDGNWNYIFDKELENGEHEVYVGITDNSGNVIAKSTPLPFVKTAEAYTRSDTVTASSRASELAPSFLNDSSMLLLGSLLIVSLGLVLMLLGLHVRSPRTVFQSLSTPV